MSKNTEIGTVVVLRDNRLGGRCVLLDKSGDFMCKQDRHPLSADPFSFVAFIFAIVVIGGSIVFTISSDMSKGCTLVEALEHLKRDRPWCNWCETVGTCTRDQWLEEREKDRRR